MKEGEQDEVLEVSDKVLSCSKDLLTIPITTSGMEVNALIDSGATSNFMSYSFLSTIQEHNNVVRMVSRKPNVVQVANKQQVKCMGTVNILLNIANKSFSVDFFVLDSLLFDVILGFNFCRKEKLVPYSPR